MFNLYACENVFPGLAQLNSHLDLVDLTFLFLVCRRHSVFDYLALLVNIDFITTVWTIEICLRGRPRSGDRRKAFVVSLNLV